MANYSFVAFDPKGNETRGVLNVADQHEAINRIKEMGCFPTKVEAIGAPRGPTVWARGAAPVGAVRGLLRGSISRPVGGGRVGRKAVMILTRQLATLVEAGMPLLRGLRLLAEQEERPALKAVLTDLGRSIEGGSSFSEALVMHPGLFNRLYVSMVKAGELGGVLDVALRRLAEFMEKAQRIKSKVVTAMIYPVAVLFVAAAIMLMLMAFVVPKFQEFFDDLLQGRSMPAFTVLVLGASRALKENLLVIGIVLAVLAAGFVWWGRTGAGRLMMDRLKLSLPIVGRLVKRVAVSRFSRTLGTLLSSGVPVLQALSIVKETAGNVIVGGAVAMIHDGVREGESIAGPLKASRVFPAMVAGMIDVGEQTGALPEMLMKIADTYDEEVDEAASALTSLLEPVMIVILAVLVGSIVIALFLPLLIIMEQM